jgi:hypothetical protein
MHLEKLLVCDNALELHDGHLESLFRMTATRRD